MTPERWEQVGRLYRAALDLGPTERTAFLRRACGDDRDMRREIESLLAAKSEAGDFLAGGAMKDAAKMLAGERSTLPAGKRLGHYQLLSPLGAGGMGEVYLAKDTRLNRNVALKLLPASFTDDRNRLARFEQEARAASALNHPNIITIYDIGETEGHHFIATEFVDGETLRQRIVRAATETESAEGRSAACRLRPVEALEIAEQIASALAEAHGAGIIHRDIKPENVMLRRDGYVKVLDFGLAKLTEPKEVGAEDSTRALVQTSAGVVMGTMPYMSPEQARGLAVDARTDIWSLGVVLYEMIAGQSPFAGPTASDVIAAILRSEPAALEVPVELEQVTIKALQKEPKARYETARELWADLKNLRQRLEIRAEMQRSGAAPTLEAGTGDVPTTTATDHRPADRDTDAVAGLKTASSAYVTKGGIRRKPAFAALGIVLLAIGSLGVYLLAARGKAIDSLAVLPFTNVTADANTEYVSDGITDSLINSLSQLPNLKVMSHNSVFRYKGQQSDAQAAGHTLGVKTVLTGRVTQRDDNLVISAELVDVRDNSHLWGEQYNRKLSDIMSVPAEISRDISEKLRLKLSGEDKRRLARRYTENAEAGQLYLKGRYFWYKFVPEETMKAVSYFQQALDKDPAFALAYAGLADSYWQLEGSGLITNDEAYRKTRASALKALELDGTLSEAHVSMALVRLFYDWNWAGAEEEYRRAIELNSNSVMAHSFYAIQLSAMLRLDEALAEATRAQDLDPISPFTASRVGWVLSELGQYDQAIEQHQKALDLDPNSAIAHWGLAEVYFKKGMEGEEIAEYLKMRALSGERPEDVAALKQAYAASGWKGYWQAALKLAREKEKQGKGAPVDLAEIYANLGEKEQAFEWLEKAYAVHNSDLVALKINPHWDGLRSDPRYADLLRRIGLPQ